MNKENMAINQIIYTVKILSDKEKRVFAIVFRNPMLSLTELAQISSAYDIGLKDAVKYLFSLIDKGLVHVSFVPKDFDSETDLILGIRFDSITTLITETYGKSYRKKIVGSIERELSKVEIDISKLFSIMLLNKRRKNEKTSEIAKDIINILISSLDHIVNSLISSLNLEFPWEKENTKMLRKFKATILATSLLVLYAEKHGFQKNETEKVEKIIDTVDSLVRDYENARKKLSMGDRDRICEKGLLLEAEVFKLTKYLEGPLRKRVHSLCTDILDTLSESYAHNPEGLSQKTISIISKIKGEKPSIQILGESGIESRIIVCDKSMIRDKSFVIDITKDSTIIFRNLVYSGARLAKSVYNWSLDFFRNLSVELAEYAELEFAWRGDWILKVKPNPRKNVEDIIIRLLERLILGRDSYYYSIQRKFPRFSLKNLKRYIVNIVDTWIHVVKIKLNNEPLEDTKRIIDQIIKQEFFLKNSMIICLFDEEHHYIRLPDGKSFIDSDMWSIYRMDILRETVHIDNGGNIWITTMTNGILSGRKVGTIQTFIEYLREIYNAVKIAVAYGIETTDSLEKIIHGIIAELDKNPWFIVSEKAIKMLSEISNNIRKILEIEETPELANLVELVESMKNTIQKHIDTNKTIEIITIGRIIARHTKNNTPLELLLGAVSVEKYRKLTKMGNAGYSLYLGAGIINEIGNKKKVEVRVISTPKGITKVIVE